jgi:xanthine dehydrogenase accessory factor
VYELQRLSFPGLLLWKVGYMKERPLNQLIVGIKGAGEMATGIAWRLYQSNIRQIFMMETATPLSVRRKVAFCEAVHDGMIMVEGVPAGKTDSIEGINTAWENRTIPVVVDPAWHFLSYLTPHVVIDAIIAKKNMGTCLRDAPLVLGLGPGFTADQDVHMVIETNRGHNLGRLIFHGQAEANTGIPGNIDGYTKQRVLRAPCRGIFQSKIPIGTLVSKGEVVGVVEKKPVKAAISGVLRGIIRSGTTVKEKFKIGDIDPRGNIEFCRTISEKARTLGGSVLEAILRTYNHQ